MADANYPTSTERAMINIHEKNQTKVVKDFQEAAKPLNKVNLQKELKASYIS